MRQTLFAFAKILGLGIFVLIFTITPSKADFKYDYFDFDEIVAVLESLESEALNSIKIILSSSN